jgi:hypothetical protein
LIFSKYKTKLPQNYVPARSTEYFLNELRFQTIKKPLKEVTMKDLQIVNVLCAIFLKHKRL